jgi:hypothetical protein
LHERRLTKADPFPGQQLVKPGLRQISDADKYVGKPRARIDAVEPCGAIRLYMLSPPPVDVLADAPTAGEIGIELPSGVRLTVNGTVDTEALSRVISMLTR